MVEAYRGLGARACVPVYNALDPETHHPVPPEHALRLRPGLPGQPAARPRGAGARSSSCGRARCCPTSAFLLGGNGWDDLRAARQRALRSGHVPTRRPQRAQLHAARGAEREPRQHGPRSASRPATRVFEAAGAGACLVTDAWEGIELFLEPEREVLVARDGAEVAAHLAGLDRGAGAPHRRGGAPARAGPAHLRPAGAPGGGGAGWPRAPGGGMRRPCRPSVSPATRRADDRSATGKLDIVVLGLSITSSWGNGHATTYRGLVRELARRGHEVLFLERDVPWYAENRDLPAPPWGRVELYRDLPDLRDRFGARWRAADAVVVGSYVPEGVGGGRLGGGDAPRGTTAFYDIDTPGDARRARRAARCEYLTPRADAPLRPLPLLHRRSDPRRLERELGRPRRRGALLLGGPGAAYRPGPAAAAAERWDLGYLGTYSDDRQPTLEELLLEPARRWPDGRFVVAGPLYPAELRWPATSSRAQHLAPPEHVAFYDAQRFTLNVTRARHGRGRLVALGAALRGRRLRHAHHLRRLGRALRLLRSGRARSWWRGALARRLPSCASCPRRSGSGWGRRRGGGCCASTPPPTAPPSSNPTWGERRAAAGLPSRAAPRSGRRRHRQ